MSGPFRTNPAAAALVVMLLILAFRAPAFYEAGNLRDVALGIVPVLILALGMTFVIVAGQIDVSIGSLFAVCSVSAGLLAAAGMPMSVVALGTCLLGGILGTVNGTLISRLGVPSIVATLAMMVILREGLRLSTGGAWVQNLPVRFQWFGLGQSAGQAVIFAVSLLLFCLFAWAARNVSAARSVYATGSDLEAARLAGIETPNVLLSVFALMGALTGLGALVNSIRFSDVQTNAGIGLELKAIAAVVVGGAAITGGRGTVFGTLAGVALLGTIGPALTFLGINPNWEKAIQGLIILSAVTSSRFAGPSSNRSAFRHV